MIGGARPELRWINVASLFVDHTYQRPVRADGQNSIRRIAGKFDWRLIGSLTVTPGRAGKYAVIDGQHRLAAARLRDLTADLPCIVIETSTVAEQAALFLALNRDRVAVQPIQQFWSALVAGEDLPRRVKAACDAAGVTIARVQTGRHKPLVTSSVGAISRAVARYGDQTTTNALAIIAASHPETPSAFGGPLMNAVFASVAGGADLIALRDALAQTDLSAALIKARVERHNNGGNIACALQAILYREMSAVVAPPASVDAIRPKNKKKPAKPSVRPATLGDLRIVTAKAVPPKTTPLDLPPAVVPLAVDGTEEVESAARLVRFLRSRDCEIAPVGASHWKLGRTTVDREGLLAAANRHRVAMDKPPYSWANRRG
ncbi:MAG: ParB N-terminal domain-containing protein [Rhodospirillales bacterium]|nr:ParB N-terminal domain-containing protein [Rhodospirillales bacterium]